MILNEVEAMICIFYIKKIKILNFDKVNGADKCRKRTFLNIILRNLFLWFQHSSLHSL